MTHLLVKLTCFPIKENCKTLLAPNFTSHRFMIIDFKLTDYAHRFHLNLTEFFF